MARSKRGRKLKDWKTNRADPGVGKLRIIGGTYRGRLIEYSGDPVTRPMKDNIREALFNLIGGVGARRSSSTSSQAQEPSDWNRSAVGQLQRFSSSDIFRPFG